MFAPENTAVCDMVTKTAARIKTTCFGNFCAAGECFESSIVALRFINAVSSDDMPFMQKLIAGISAHMEDKRRHLSTMWYYWLCLSELPPELAYQEILHYKDHMLAQISKSYVIINEQDKLVYPTCLFIARNCLVRFPEYEYISEREPYISEKDGRLHFDMRVIQ